MLMMWPCTSTAVPGRSYQQDQTCQFKSFISDELTSGGSLSAWMWINLISIVIHWALKCLWICCFFGFCYWSNWIVFFLDLLKVIRAYLLDREYCLAAECRVSVFVCQVIMWLVNHHHIFSFYPQPCESWFHHTCHRQIKTIISPHCRCFPLVEDLSILVQPMLEIFWRW